MAVGRRRSPPPTKKSRLEAGVSETLSANAGSIEERLRASFVEGACSVDAAIATSFVRAFWLVPMMRMPTMPFRCSRIALYGNGVGSAKTVSLGVYRTREVTSGRFEARLVTSADDQSWDTTPGVRQADLAREINVDPRTGFYFIGITAQASSVSLFGAGADGIRSLFTASQVFTGNAVPASVGYGTGNEKLSRSTSPPFHARLISTMARRMMCD